MRRQRLTRREVLVGLGIAGAGPMALSGCRSPASPTIEAGEGASLRYQLVAAYPTGIPFVAAGSPVRLPFQISRSDGSIVDDLPDPLDLRIWRDNRATGEVVPARPWTDGDAAYLTIDTEFDESVDYEVRGDFDGVPLLATVRVARPELVGTPPVGAPMPSTVTATNAATLGVDPICTLTPECRWHDVSLDVALRSATPVALVIGSDVYCTDDRCGPSLRGFVRVATEFPTVTSIHAEPFRDPLVTAFPDRTARTEVTKVLGITWEPATFFVDRSGTILARADGIVGPDELRELFALIA